MIACCWLAGSLELTGILCLLESSHVIICLILALSLEMPQPAHPRDSGDKNQDPEDGVFVLGFDKNQPAFNFS